MNALPIFILVSLLAGNFCQSSLAQPAKTQNKTEKKQNKSEIKQPNPIALPKTKTNFVSELNAIESFLNAPQDKKPDREEIKDLMAQLNGILVLSPKNSKALYLKGVIYFLTGDEDEALHQINRALFFDAKNKEALCYRALIETMHGKPNEALADYNSAIANGENGPRVYSNRGSVYQQMGKHKEAIADFNLAVAKEAKINRFSNSMLVTRLMRANSYNFLKNYKEATEDFKFALANNLPQNLRGEAYRNFGICLFHLKEYKASAESYTLALSLIDNKEKAQVLALRSATYRQLGELDKSAKDLSLAKHLGLSLEKIEKKPTAQKQPDKVISGTKNDMEARMAPFIKQAREGLPSVKKRFMRGMAPGNALIVTTRIYGESKEQIEQVFVEVRNWRGETLEGKLASPPRLKNHQEGESLIVREADVLDWTIVKPDGSHEGNFVGHGLETK